MKKSVCALNVLQSLDGGNMLVNLEARFEDVFLGQRDEQALVPSAWA